MSLIEDFRQYLKIQGVSTNTCKNYVSDLSTFVNYLKTQNQYFSILTLPFVLNSPTLNSYKKWLEKRDRLSTANRRLSSLRKFISFAIESNSISREYTGSVINFIVTTPDGPVQSSESIEEFLKSQYSDTNTSNLYTNDINSYLLSKSIPSRSFSLKGFWRWKNSIRANNTPNRHPAPKLTYLLIGMGGIFILGSLILVGLTYKNSRSSALHEPAFLSLLRKNSGVSLKPLLTIWDSAPSGASGLIDPTQSISYNNSKLDTSIFKRAWSKLKPWLGSPEIFDPTLE